MTRPGLRDAGGARGHPPQPVQRARRGTLPHLELRVRQRGAGRGALRRRRRRHGVFALHQSHGAVAAGAACRARGRGVLCRHRIGHVGDTRLRARPAARRRSHRGIARSVRRNRAAVQQLAAALRHRDDIRSRHATFGVVAGIAAQHTHAVPRDALEPAHRGLRHCRRGAARARAWRFACRRQLLLHACAAAPARAGRRSGHPLGDQVSRRAGQGDGWRGARPARADRGAAGRFSAQRRAHAVAFQRLGHPQGTGDAEAARGGTLLPVRSRWPRWLRGASARGARVLPGPCRATRSSSWLRASSAAAGVSCPSWSRAGAMRPGAWWTPPG